MELKRRLAIKKRLQMLPQKFAVLYVIFCGISQLSTPASASSLACGGLSKNDLPVRPRAILQKENQQRLYNSSEIRASAFSPDGQLLASASNDKAIRLWIASTGALLK